MSDIHSFEVRRPEETGNGDGLRDTAQAVLRLGATTPAEFKGKITATPLDYDKVVVDLGSLVNGEGQFVTQPQTLEWAALVRSSFGFPGSPDEGAVLLLVDSVDTLPDTLTDTGLIPGRWYYYSLLLKYAGSRWVAPYRAEALVPVDYGHGQKMYDLVPPYYRSTDEQDYRGLQNETIYRFLATVGYDLDLTRTLAEGVQEMWNPDTAPRTLINLLGTQNLGAEDLEQIGDLRFRALVSDHRRINEGRGTLSGLKRFVEAVGKFEVGVTPGLNELLLVDDAEFLESTGHWAPAPYTVSRILNNNVPLDTSYIEISVVPESEIIDFPTEAV